MLGELVSVLTADRVRLDGFWCESKVQDFVGAVPVEKANRPPIDAAIIVHGLSGNFYQSRLLKHFSNALLNLGISSVLVNTRGHDFLNSTPRMGRAATLGAAVEVIDECRFDLNAWSEFLVKRGHQRILLLGHSLGAIKSLYCQAHQPHPNVVAIAAYSATKLSFDSLLSSAAGDRFSHWLQTAKQWIADGNGDRLMEVDFPFPTLMSASAYLNKYGNGDRYNWLSFMDRIDVPTLLVFGGIEMRENPAFMAMTDDLKNIRQPNFRIEYIDRADHFYSACFEAAASTLNRWMDQLNR